MINTSQMYKNEIKGNRIMSLHDKYLFPACGGLELSACDFIKYTIDESTSEQSTFSIGAAVIKKYSATLNNESGKFSTYDFEGLDILARVGIKLPDGTTEILPKGRYRCVSARSNENTISVEAYDSMLFFDRPYSESSLSYPAKVGEIIADACQMCGMTYDETTVEQRDFVVEKCPDKNSMTFRDVIAYCAQIMGCYAKIDSMDKLVFGWYDFSVLEKLQNGYEGGNFSDYNSGTDADGGDFLDYETGAEVSGGTFRESWDYHHLFSLGSQSINTDDITVTGICVVADKGDSEEAESYFYGNDGYVLTIENNPLIISGTKQGEKTSARVVAEHIEGKIVDKTIRPLSISCQSNPAIEAGDCICVTDRKQRTYFTVVTNTTYVFGGTQKIECTAETPTENNYEKYSAATKLLKKAEDEAERKITQYDIAVQHLTDVMAQSFGVFKTVVMDDSGANIYYMHDKPRLEDSKNIWKMTADGLAVSTDGMDEDGNANWKAGITADGNAVVNVLSAIGINAGWIRTGSILIGGKQTNEDGTVEVYDEQGELVCEISKKGVHVKKGTINLGNGRFSVDENGNVLIQQGTIGIGDGSFKVDADGNVSITKGSINIGDGNFKADAEGNVTMLSAEVWGNIIANEMFVKEILNMYSGENLCGHRPSEYLNALKAENRNNHFSSLYGADGMSLLVGDGFAQSVLKNSVFEKLTTTPLGSVLDTSVPGPSFYNNEKGSYIDKTGVYTNGNVVAEKIYQDGRILDELYQEKRESKKEAAFFSTVENKVSVSGTFYAMDIYRVCCGTATVTLADNEEVSAAILFPSVNDEKIDFAVTPMHRRISQVARTGSCTYIVRIDTDGKLSIKNTGGKDVKDVTFGFRFDYFMM